ncbi:MAG: amino acid adenylation domain-containing protein [Candidatus Eisenbacteria bacterium]|uniref:Amino acid adenylation domain-containing protein n=1 Tax=Eiseniibacteriota bacterium TaxID=2212470 RepID=A0A538TPC1_UNCEI|nr:MAG: amino acid adenylation domain-containing protein [Candidatus Eisenbacteria bacterium]
MSDGPSVTDEPDRPAGEILAGEELQLLDALLDAEGVATCRTPCIPKLGARVAPLSSAQRRLWFLQEIDPLSSAYTISGAVLLRGDLDLAALQAALDGVVARHEVLRTTFESDAGEPRQRVHAAMPVVLRRTPGDASLPAAESARVAAELAHPAWDLGRGPLVRAAVVEFSPREHSLVIAMHHIVADGWSIGILLRELGALYNAGLAHLPPSLPEPPVQYADYALWQRQWLEREVLDEELRYWKQQLAGAPERLDLPADGPQPATRGRRGAQQPLSLSAELTESLKALGRREGATLFMTLLAAFQALLHRYTGQDDIVLGTPVAGRHQSEVEGLIGFFVNTLVLRSDLSGDPTFVQLLGRVREVALGAYAHQDLPFEQLVEALRPARDMRHTPLFQVMFALQNAPAEELHLHRLSSTLLPIDVPTAKFDLTLNLAEEGPLLSGTFEYDADRFASATVLRMAGHFQTLLEAIAAHPWTRLSRLPLLTEKESHQLLADREPLHDGAPGRCAHQCFEEQAERTPEAVAVEFQERMLTFGELDQRANQLAHLLRGMGVGSDDVVGLHMERSLEMVVGLLGIQKAGGAYLPLDPSYPRERRSFMLRDARAVLLLTQTGLQDDLPGTAAPIIAVDDRWKLLEGHSRAAPAGSPRPESLAYVIYTSGSTGSPRGVMISHRALGNHMRWMAAAFPLAESDRVLQKTPTSFDASVWEFYAPLIAGARLILARPEGHQDAAYLIDTVQQQGITTLQLVPSMLALLLEDEGVRSCTSLKRVFCGGEVLPWEMQERFFAQLPAADLINLYGPTEATIDATFWACRKSGPRRKVPIGSPIANLRAYVLDSRLQLLPLGVPGELHLAGDGLARGYRGDPAWTAQRFVPDPFSAAAGARLYRTGDLARRLAGGELEFLGRIDHQVKMRGLRVDPQEIEAVLAEHPAVSKAAVVACEDPAGSASQGPRLVAYLAPVPGKAPTPEDLRSFLGERLPRFMIPAVFVSLEALPLTPSGKIDRRALPSPRSIGPALDGAGIAPRTPTEEILAGIWSQLLRIERVGREDNFFDLGGHSLLAMRVAVRLRRLFGIELPLRCLFDAPTLRGLAARVEQAGRSPTPPLVPATPAQRLRPSYAQRRLWFLHRLEPHSPAYNIANAIRVEGKLDVKAIGSALSEIVRRHEALRTRFEEGPDGPVPLVDPPAPVALTIEDLTGLAPDSREGEAARLAGRAARESFDLAHGPLLRVRLLRLGPADHILIVVIHHIAADGWSMGVLVRELAAAYAAHARGATLPTRTGRHGSGPGLRAERWRGSSLGGVPSWTASNPSLFPPTGRAPGGRPTPGRPSRYGWMRIS